MKFSVQFPDMPESVTHIEVNIVRVLSDIRRFVPATSVLRTSPKNVICG